MGLIHLRLMQRDDGQGHDDGSRGSFATTTQIAIGVIVPVVVLLGGLVCFIWSTEKRRRKANIATDRAAQLSRGHHFLPKDSMRGSRFIDSPHRAYSHTGLDHHYHHKDRHERGNTSFGHELEDSFGPAYGINKPLPMHLPPRKDSAITMPHDHAATLPQHVHNSLLGAPTRSQRHSVVELPAKSPVDVRRHSVIDTVCYSTAPPDPKSGWRASLQSVFLPSDFASKRDRRGSKASWSPYKTCTFDMIEPPSRRRRSNSDVDDEPEGKRSHDSASSTPTVATSELDLTRQPSQNLLSAARPGSS